MALFLGVVKEPSNSVTRNELKIIWFHTVCVLNLSLYIYSFCRRRKENFCWQKKIIVKGSKRERAYKASAKYNFFVCLYIKVHNNTQEMCEEERDEKRGAAPTLERDPKAE